MDDYASVAIPETTQAYTREIKIPSEKAKHSSSMKKAKHLAEKVGVRVYAVTATML